MESQTETTAVLLEPGSKEFMEVTSKFISDSVDFPAKILKIHRIENRGLWKGYCRKRTVMKQELTHDHLINEKFLFHGTSVENINNIVKNGFDPKKTVNSMHGFGTYFSNENSFSHEFADCAAPGQYPDIVDDSSASDTAEDVIVDAKHAGEDNLQETTLPARTRTRHFMLGCHVLVGRSTKGHRDYVQPPLVNPHHLQGPRYHSCYEYYTRGSEYVIFDTYQMFPRYLIEYEFNELKTWWNTCGYLNFFILNFVIALITTCLFFYALDRSYPNTN